MKIDVECLIWPLCGRGGGTGVGGQGLGDRENREWKEYGRPERKSW